MASARPGVKYDAAETQTWDLPEDFKPLSMRQLVWSKATSMPAVGIGMIATVGAFGMASYSMRLGNSVRMNFWLRMRVVCQAATIGAMVYYGGIAFSRQEQTRKHTEQMILLGDLPRTHPLNKPAEIIFPDSPEPTSDPTSPSSDGDALMDSLDRRRQAEEYPLPVEQRMRVSDFARRLRRAERAQEEEDAAKRERSERGEPEDRRRMPVTEAGAILRARLDRAGRDKEEREEVEGVKGEGRKPKLPITNKERYSGAAGGGDDKVV